MPSTIVRPTFPSLRRLLAYPFISATHCWAYCTRVLPVCPARLLRLRVQRADDDHDRQRRCLRPSGRIGPDVDRLFGPRPRPVEGGPPRPHSPRPSHARIRERISPAGADYDGPNLLWVDDAIMRGELGSARNGRIARSAHPTTGSAACTGRRSDPRRCRHPPHDRRERGSPLHVRGRRPSQNPPR